jgi:hypothetical protein
MWELKGVNVRYSFISHNCGTGTVNIIKVIYPDVIDTKFYKFFKTPIDYVKMFERGKIIENINLIRSDEYELKSKKGKKKNILDAKRSSQIYAGYKGLGNGGLELRYMPVYQDFYDVSKAYYDDIETKMLSIDLAYHNKLYINKVDLVSMRSIVDYKTLSKYFRLSLENYLGRTNTGIKPVMEGGAGYSYALFNRIIKPYILPKIGYRYDNTNNFYVVPEFGIIFKPADNIKIVVSYEKYFDSRYNNRGFGKKLSTNFAYLFFDETTLYLKYNQYSDTSDKDDQEFMIGIGYSF